MQSTPTITRDELRDIAEQGLKEFAVPQQLAAEVMGAVETLEIFQLGGFGACQDHTCIIGEVRKRRGLSGVGLVPRVERFERNPELELGAFYDQRVRRVTGISYTDPRGIDAVNVVDNMHADEINEYAKPPAGLNVEKAAARFGQRLEHLGNRGAQHHPPPAVGATQLGDVR